MQVKVFDLGLIDYAHAWESQKQLFGMVRDGFVSSAVISCRHNPVITLGRLAQRQNIRCPADELEKRGIRVYETERGGDVTYHGPGQVMLYPVFNLALFKKDIHLFLRQLECAAISFLSEWTSTAAQRTGLTGVWVNGRKIASVGIAVRNWVTFHGLSINIKEADLENYRFIRPCGMNIEMTALEAVIRGGVAIERVSVNLIKAFCDVFGVSALLADKEELLCLK